MNGIVHWRWLQGIVCASAFALAVTSCAVGQARQLGHVDSLGCFTGKFAMRVMSARVQAGRIVRLAANGPQGSGFVGLDSWGVFGRARNGSFVALYDVPAVPAQEHVSGLRPIAVSSAPKALAGTGLPNMPFVTRIPAVPAGNYIVRFDFKVYGLRPSELRKLGLPANRLYPLCAKVAIAS